MMRKVFPFSLSLSLSLIGLPTCLTVSSLVSCSHERSVDFLTKTQGNLSHQSHALECHPAATMKDTLKRYACSCGEKLDGGTLGVSNCVYCASGHFVLRRNDNKQINKRVQVSSGMHGPFG